VDTPTNLEGWMPSCGIKLEVDLGAGMGAAGKFRNRWACAAVGAVVSSVRERTPPTSDKLRERMTLSF
jgi:hypothetical protein